MIERALALGLGFALLGCAPKTGWERTTSRVCEPKQPATVCLEARPDQPIEAHVGGEVLLPGECAVAPKRGGQVRVETQETHATERRWVRAPKGKRTTVVIAQGERRIGKVRRGCDQRPQ